VHEGSSLYFFSSARWQGIFLWLFVDGEKLFLYPKIQIKKGERGLKQNLFSRSLYNDLKTGAYYTDTEHACRLGQLFTFSEETCVLEPSFGDGLALKAFLDGAAGTREKVVRFGVELDPEAHESGKANFDYSLNEDFLKGVRISPQSFSLVFTNPPYGECNEGKNRLETEFIKRLYTYTIPGAHMVLIVPRACLEDGEFIREYASRFEILRIYRFDDKEYQKYHQYALIGQRRNRIGVLRSEMDELRTKIHQDQFPYIPEKGEYDGEKFLVNGSSNEGVTLFTGIKFDYAHAAANLKKNSLYDKMSQATVPKYYALKVGDPPLPLKKDLLYLAAIAGAGEGIAGREEDGDIHLQRGVVKPETFLRPELLENGQEVMIETTKNVVTINLIDSFGNIRTLK